MTNTIKTIFTAAIIAIAANSAAAATLQVAPVNDGVSAAAECVMDYKERTTGHIYVTDEYVAVRDGLVDIGNTYAEGNAVMREAVRAIIAGNFGNDAGEINYCLRQNIGD
jgi:hypothetical protein